MSILKPLLFQIEKADINNALSAATEARKQQEKQDKKLRQSGIFPKQENLDFFNISV